MYEYCGSLGGNKALGPQRRCKTLNQAHKGPGGRDDYTHISWSEIGNADVTDPDTFEDLRKILDITIADEKSKASFLGAWIRPRNSGMPVSFSDLCLKRFSEQTRQPQMPTRAQLKSNRTLYRDYLNWWHVQRRDFLTTCRDYLRDSARLGPEAVILFTETRPSRATCLKEAASSPTRPPVFPEKKPSCQTLFFPGIWAWPLSSESATPGEVGSGSTPSPVSTPELCPYSRPHTHHGVQ